MQFSPFGYYLYPRDYPTQISHFLYLNETEQQMKNIFEQAYDHESFREQGHQLVNLLAEYLKDATNRTIDKVLPNTDPEDQLKKWDSNHSGKNLNSFFEKVLENSTKLQHPKYMGHQVSPTLPVAALADLFSALMNNGTGVFEMGPASNALEYQICEMTAHKMGLGPKSGGFLTSGGTLANLTALLTARAIKIPNAWEEGTDSKYAFLVSEQSHYCVDRAVRIMGWGASGAIKVKSNEKFQMDIEAMKEAYHLANQNNITVIGIIASAPSTSTGSYDDLTAIGGFCKEMNLWFHVDAAHGGAFIFSKNQAHILKGVELADSVIMDFHKMLLVPALTTAVMYKDRRLAHSTFNQNASYLWAEDNTDEWENSAKVTFECTKLMMSIKVQSIIEAHGFELWEEYLDRVIYLTKYFESQINNKSQWELACSPESNIICYRWIGGQSIDHCNTVNKAVRQRVIDQGPYYIVITTINGKTYLRSTLMNPLSTEKDIDELIELIDSLAKELN